MSKTMADVVSPNEESLRSEYIAAQDAFLHYDNFPWTVGSVLIAGVLVFWGLLLESVVAFDLLVICSFLVVFIMSTWALFTHHNRQIYLSKLHRIREIEQILGLGQHSRWMPTSPGAKPIYHTLPPHGYHLDTLIYLTVCIGTPLIGAVKAAPDPRMGLLGLPILLAIMTILWNWRNERAIQKHLKQLDQVVDK